ncbi:hypothetical protein GA0115256_109516 [Streptomyces sp. DconLS]|nr:hypothetical protein GA0115256_109516 [Streptomyces sp. DconLS]
MRSAASTVSLHERGRTSGVPTARRFLAAGSSRFAPRILRTAAIRSSYVCAMADGLLYAVER